MQSEAKLNETETVAVVILKAVKISAESVRIGEKVNNRIRDLKDQKDPANKREVHRGDRGEGGQQRRIN